MSDEVPSEFRALAAKLQENGARPILVATNDSEIPWVLVKAPKLSDLSAYSMQINVAGPLMASVGLARMSFVSLVGQELEAVVARKPFFVQRVIQAVLRDLGLGTRAEKKSLP